MKRYAVTFAGCLFVAAGSLAQPDEIIWDYGPHVGEYGGCWLNDSNRQNFAENVLFDEFVELTGLAMWTCVNQPQGNMELKILFADPFLNGPGEDYVRGTVDASEYRFDENFGGTDLYRVDFDFSPILLRANTEYWIGIAGNGWSLGQASVLEPGDGRMAQFKGREYIGSGIHAGDQMFQLRGRVVAPPFELTLDGVCPGEITASVIGATPGGQVAFIHGACDGQTTVPGGPCAGTVLPVGDARLISVISADDEGDASVTGTVPDIACGELCIVALDLETCSVSAVGRTYDRPELYTGERIDQPLGFADFNAGGYRSQTIYDEGGMTFRYVHDLGSYLEERYCGGDGTLSLYMRHINDILGITRVDGEEFNAIEFTAGDGYVNNCTLAYLWIRTYLDGVPIADFTIDQPVLETVGLRGGRFDEVRVGAYPTPEGRDAACQLGNERFYQALALDNVRFGTISPWLFLSGECPGKMTAEVTSATPHGEVAFIAGACDQQTILPSGPCAGTVLPVGRAQLINTARADAEGVARLTGEIPANACGTLCLVALDIVDCRVSNAVAIE